MGENQIPQWFIGTMGYSYADWKGAFYPAETQPRGYLAYYSRIFNGVEIDSSFYGTPRLSTLQGWAAATPADFKFCLKVPRVVTHDSGLVGYEAVLNEFVTAARTLEDKLGALLFQFPPSFAAGEREKLKTLLENLPGGVRYAVEVRHPSWYTPEAATGEPALAELLNKFGVCWAATEYPELPRRIYPTTNFFYIRWIGQHGTFTHHTQERLDRTPELREWSAMLSRSLSLRTDPIETVFGFFNNDYAGFGPGTAQRFRKLTGLEAPWIEPPRQERLF